MKIFKLNKRFSVVCNSEGTRNGFRHIAVLHSNGLEVTREKVCYLNRTWERYEFETILINIITNNFKDKEQQKYLNTIGKIKR